MEKLSLNKSIFWLLLLVVAVFPIFGWGSFLSWDFSYLDTATVFPLLGLLAFSIMWLQMAVNTLFKNLSSEFLNGFFFWSGWVFLLLIIAHPLLLDITVASQSGGLSLESLYEYVGSKQRTFLSLGIFAWIIFISYELFSKFKRWQHYRAAMNVFKYLNYIGFYLVFAHSINLGTHLQSGYLRVIWYIYAVSAVYFIYRDLTKKTESVS